jgi:hypothetical protein
VIAFQQNLPAATGAHEAVAEITEAGRLIAHAGENHDGGNQEGDLQ